MRRWRSLLGLVTGVVALAVVTAGGAGPAAARSPGRWRPLVGRAPAWYTPALHARVMAAGDAGVPLPRGVEVPTSSVVFLGIRPGQPILLSTREGLVLCTTNFVFRSGSRFAIGTAGHCGDVGDPVTMLVLPRGLVNIGTISKSTGAGSKIGDDFALISIRPSLNGLVSPSMPYWGGPVGPWTGPGAPLVVEHGGWGIAGVPRVGVGTVFSSREWRFIGVVSFGDSGGAAVSGDHRAIGNITHIALQVGGGRTSTVAGTSIARILTHAGMPLATCSPLPWPLPGCP
jgi:hypothetical protein